MTTRSPRVPDPQIDGLAVLADAMGNGGDPSRAIVESEKRGQRELVNSDVIPSKLSYCTEEDLAALGFVLGDQVPGDPLFRYATLPAGWARQGSDHDMWSYIVDPLSRRRVGLFYKAAYYDRKASLSIHSLSYYVSACLNEKTEPVLDEEWATRDAVIAVAGERRDSFLVEAKRWRDGIESGRFQAAQVEEFAVRDEAEAATYEALRARLAGEAR